MLKNTELFELFPIFKNTYNGKNLIYLDNAATTQRPISVIEAITDYYRNYNAGVHRGTYKIAELATQAYESAREKVRQFINAKSSEEIIFTRGTTEAINLVASSFGEKYISANDEILISTMEHHANIVPWQMLCEKTGAKLQVCKITPNGEIDLDDFTRRLNHRTKIVALIQVSNVLGTINPIKEMIKLAHQQKIPVLVDGAQAVAHLPTDVQNLDCDFYAFSGHKMYGPTGIGILYGKKIFLDAIPPYQGGGSMIKSVTFAKTEYADLPQKFEAGTPNIAGTIGLGAAIDFLQKIGIENITKHEAELLKYTEEKLTAIPTLKIIGKAKNKTGVISIVFPKIHPHDISTILDSEMGIATRAGHHCAMPLMQHYGIPATTRISLGIYNTKADIDKLVVGLHKVLKIMIG